MDSHKAGGVAAMALIAIVAEGPSEQQFITNNLAPLPASRLAEGNCLPQAIVVKNQCRRERGKLVLGVVAGIPGREQAMTL
ncbi:Uncharacterised protein [Mobiluncus mulieris]|nr:Uncharacterised protein [Mobiluncus mulieris]